MDLLFKNDLAVESDMELLKYKPYAYLTKPVATEYVCSVEEYTLKRGLHRRQAEQKHEIFNYISNFSLIPVAVYDLLMQILFINPASTKVFGYTPEEAIGNRIPFIPDFDIERTESEIQGLISVRPIQKHQTQRLNRDGEFLTVEKHNRTIQVESRAG